MPKKTSRYDYHFGPNARPQFGYIKHINGKWVVYRWENTHGEQCIGEDVYTNIDPFMVSKSIDSFGIREGPMMINYWDCRIDKSVNSVIL